MSEEVVILETRQVIHSNSTICKDGYIILSSLGGKEVNLIVNITNSPIGIDPTLQYTIQEMDPVNWTTPLASFAIGYPLTGINTQILVLPDTTSGTIKVSWTVSGSGCDGYVGYDGYDNYDGYVIFTGVNASVGSKITSSLAVLPSTNITISVAASTFGTVLLPSNLNRLGATIYNDAPALLYVKLGADVSVTDFTIKLFPYSYYEVPFGFTGEIDGFWSNTGGFARIGELTN